MKTKTLTIAIPTYNRPDKILVQLKSLLPQITEEIEVVVLDNHSDVPITSVVTNDILSKICIIRNDINIGGAANIARCFEVCKTEWLWTLSDDDIVEKDAVAKILNTIKGLSDICYINFNNKQTFSSNNFSEVLKNGGLYQDFYYMSVCVYNIKKIQTYMHHYYRALSTMQPGIYMIVKYLAEHPNEKCLISNLQIVNDGSTDISWNRMTFVYASLYLIDLLRNQEKNFKSNMFKSIISDCGFCVYDSYKNRKISFMEVIKTLISMIKRRGLINTLIYDIKVYIKNLGLCIFR